MIKYSSMIFASLLALAAFNVGAEEAAATPPAIVAPNDTDVIKLLEESADWYKVQQATASLASDPRELALKDSLARNGENSLRRAIDFARAEATIIGAMPVTAPVPDTDKKAADTSAAPATRAANLAAAATTIDRRVADLQAGLKDTNIKLARTAGRTRAPLVAMRDKQKSEIELARAQSDLLKTIAGLVGGTTAVGAADLSARIDEFEKLLPDATAKAVGKPATGPVPAASATADIVSNASPYDYSIFNLASRTTELTRKKARISELGQQSNAMRDEVQGLLTTLRNQLQAAGRQGDLIAQNSATDDLAALATQKQSLDTLVTTFKQLSVAITPLAEQNSWIEASQRNLAEWAKALDTSLAAALRALVVRLTLLVLAILVPLLLSELARRAINRYVQEERRQRQFRTVRKTLVTIAIIAIVCMNFFSEFGSLATYAGLLTAGLAVALQNVILSIVAHFFFVGRFGVRVGDRVTIGNVTGDIVELGWVRIYMMELSDDRASHPTGRIVAFPNSILFQQSAFYKQIPGTHYGWHAVTLVLASGTDYQNAQDKLLAALQGVYADYVDSMKQQQSILEHSTRLKIALPEPEARMKFVDSGLAFEGRYPVEFGRASEIDNRVTRALLKTVRNNSEIQLASGGLPKVEAAD